MIALHRGSRSRRALAPLAAMALGAALAAPARAQATAPTALPVGVEQDTLLFDVVPETLYMNGGIGKDQQQFMRQDARHWPLRMAFSDKSTNEFVADVRLQVFDQAGKAVLRLQSAGPMTFVQLRQGDYRISATYRGEQQVRQVHIGPKGVDVSFHWKA